MSSQEKPTSSYTIIKRGEKKNEQKKERETDWMYLTPMIAAPLLPLSKYLIISNQYCDQRIRGFFI
jgi:hypothetical protein